MNSNLMTAIRGPILLIAVGVLFAVDHSGGYAVRQSWPVLLVLAGLLKLLERVAVPDPPVAPPPAPPPSAPPPPGFGGMNLPTPGGN